MARKAARSPHVLLLSEAEWVRQSDPSEVVLPGVRSDRSEAVLLLSGERADRWADMLAGAGSDRSATAMSGVRSDRSEALLSCVRSDRSADVLSGVGLGDARFHEDVVPKVAGDRWIGECGGPVSASERKARWTAPSSPRWATRIGCELGPVHRHR